MKARASALLVLAIALVLARLALLFLV